MCQPPFDALGQNLDETPMHRAAEATLKHLAAASRYPVSIATIIRAEPLQAFVQQVCQAMGAAAEVASEVARHLVRANLSGHDSHGVLRLAQYVAEMDHGDLKPGARPVLLRESGASALVDAGRGFGQFSTMVALEWGLERARKHGVAAAAVRHSMHIGRLGEYGERAAEAGFLAIVTVGVAGPGSGRVAPHGGAGRFLSTNPWSLAVPAAGRPAFVFDAATSTVAEGKVRLARVTGARLPPGSVRDSEGNPTTDPEQLYAGGTLTPFGGEVAGHKGYGLSLASALFGGLAMIDDPEPSAGGNTVPLDDWRSRLAGVFVAVFDPGAFGDAGRYQARVGETLAAASRVPPAAGFQQVLVPGEPEARTRALREREGIALPEPTWADLEVIARRFGLELPERDR